MLPTLTKRQKEILDFIRVYDEINGYSPSLEDIKQHFNLSAVSTVHEHISNLEKKGFLVRELNQARSIQVVKNKASLQNIIEVPIIFTLQNKLLQESKLKEILPVAKQLISSKEKLFGIKSIDNSIQGISAGGILILSGMDNTTLKDTLLLQNAQKELILGKKLQQRPRKLYTNLLTNAKCSNLIEVGVLILHIKKFL